MDEITVFTWSANMAFYLLPILFYIGPCLDRYEAEGWFGGIVCGIFGLITTQTFYVKVSGDWSMVHMYLSLFLGSSITLVIAIVVSVLLRKKYYGNY